MQELKSYRESNPGKGYLDWKVQALQGGGEVEQVRNAITEARAATGAPNQFLDNWNKKRLATGKFDSQLGNGLIDTQKANRDSAAIYESPIKYGRNSYLRGTPLMKSASMTTEEAELRLLKDAAQFGRSTKHRLSGDANQKGLVGIQQTKGEYSPTGNAIYAPTPDVLTHEQSHASKAIPQEQRIQQILGGSNTGSTDYLDRPTEVYSRLMELREANQLDPLKVWEKKDIKELRKTGTDYDILNRYKDEDILDLFNTVADNSTYDIPMVADGGEIPPTYRGGYDKEGNMVLPVTNEGDIQNITTPQITITPRDNLDLSTSIDRGRRAFGDIGKEVISNTTPFGDIESAVYAYDAFKDNDWLGLGLSLAGTLPLVPRVSRAAKNKITRPTPTVNKNTEKLIDAQFDKIEKEKQQLSKVANEQYRAIENLMDDPSYLRRAKWVKEEFGDDYTKAYADLMLKYNNNPDELPRIKLMNDPTKGGSMRKLDDGTYMYENNPDSEIPYVTLHELSHLTDILKSGTKSAEAGNNLFYKMSKDLDKVVGDGYDTYFKNPSEQKAHMNQVRQWLLDRGYITYRDQETLPEIIEIALEEMSKERGLKAAVRASKQFKSMKTYTKWFDSVPVLGVGALGANNYFNRQNTNNDK